MVIPVEDIDRHEIVRIELDMAFIRGSPARGRSTLGVS